MTEYNFYPTSNLLTCAFTERMDGIRSAEAENIIKVKLEEIGEGDTDRAGLRIAFDLAEVDYVSSGFIRICIALAREVEKGNFSLINTSPFVSKIFKTSGLEQVLNVS